jgi:hypothetical protein
MPYCINGRMNAEDHANMEITLAETVRNVAQTLLCQRDVRDLLDLTVKVSIFEPATGGDTLYEGEMTVERALEILELNEVA